VDGAGKTTQARLLAQHLRTRGDDVVDVREPGGTEVGERIRSIVLDPGATMADRTEALLFAAARAELWAEVIAPALQRGAAVVADRYLDSSLVYQGIVRGLGVDKVRDLSLFALESRLPDRTVLLELEPAEAATRRHEAPDRIESEPDGFQASVAQGYADLAQADERFVVVDATGPPDSVAGRVREALGV
jgi:dTMP kinase